MSHVSIGVIGCGAIARSHVPAYQANQDKIKVVAVSDVMKERAKELGKILGAEGYTDYSEILKRNDVDAVHILLPHSIHYEATVRAAEAGKHVLCIKPIATTLEDARQMIEASKKYNVKLMIEENWRLVPEIIHTKKLVDEGSIGEIFLANSDRVSWLPPHLMSGFRSKKDMQGGGCIIDHGPHMVDLMRWVIGEVEAVTAFSNRIVRKEMEGEDTGCVLLKHETDAISILRISWAMKHRMPQVTDGLDFYRFYGSEGVITSKGDGNIFLTKESKTERFQVPGGVPASFKETLRHFADCILENKPPTKISAEEGYNDLKVVIAAYKSIQTGQTINMKDLPDI